MHHDDVNQITVSVSVSGCGVPVCVGLDNLDNHVSGLVCIVCACVCVRLCLCRCLCVCLGVCLCV